MDTHVRRGEAPTFRPICADKTEPTVATIPRTRPATANRQFSPSTQPALPSLFYQRSYPLQNVTRPPSPTILRFLRDCSATTVCLTGHSAQRNYPVEDFRNFRRVPTPFHARSCYFLVFSSAILFLVSLRLFRFSFALSSVRRGKGNPFC